MCSAPAYEATNGSNHIRQSGDRRWGVDGLEDWRIYDHPILNFNRGKQITIFLDGQPVKAFENETVAAALYAAGLREFSRSIKYRRPRGFFCAIGRCSSCMMEVDGVSNVRTCTTMVKEGMQVKRQRYLADFASPFLNQMKLTPQVYMKLFTRPGFIYGPAMTIMRQFTGIGNLPAKVSGEVISQKSSQEIETELLIIGGGPAGLSGAIEAGQRGVETIIVDDKAALGGQLVKQTHTFFSDVKYAAGRRGFNLGAEMVGKVEKLSTAKILNSTDCVGYYPEENVALLTRSDGTTMRVRAKKYLLSTGAYEKNLVFNNNDLPGVYGAGGVQTLLNVYGVKPGNNGLIIGTGNVALMVAYHLLQAGIEVEAIVAPSFKRLKGYFVHAAKIRRNGIPIITGHTISKALGGNRVTGAEIVRLDEKYEPIPGTERRINCDFICIGVGLTPSFELAKLFGAKMVNNGPLGGFVPIRDKEFRITDKAYIAGDCSSIEEATTAVLAGGLAGLYATKALGKADSTLESKTKEYTEALAHDRSSPFSKALNEGLAMVTVNDIQEVIL